ncbi:phiEco32-like amidoligase-type 2 protein [Melghirimyces profundicolus]|uniref:PhiEco32-like amidoligase-type 2 protein n=1 Tax=Melghirimyces profundicolus TaxID=1242148 RepID=A0A2T6BRH8_9BACL|nr:hypothetical protein [Melghirimyces profundicolus]PTX58683.1 phiEco32-like amidoligase-type 2 protein [Melghirimyces profundicolus]
MEALMLPTSSIDQEREVQNRLVTPQNTLAPSVRLQGPLEKAYVKPIVTLNEEDAVERANDRAYKISVLKLHGMAVAEGKIQLLKRYIVCVFQTQVLLMYRSREPKAWLASNQTAKTKTFKRLALSENTRETRRVKALAVRALYALGLDYGVVTIGIRPGIKAVVLDVNPGPLLNQEMIRQFSDAVCQYIRKLPQLLTDLDQVVLGADPEFIMRKTSDGKLVMASDYFPRFGRVGCDAIWHGQNRSAKPLVELRPKPTNDPRQLVLRMYQGMMQASRRIKDKKVQWLSGALPHPGFPLGGHIHFSGIPLNFKLLRALDHYLALPLVMVEDPKGIRRRPKYGFLGDYRVQFHGGFEYRTLPSWLVSPTLTKGILSAAKLVAAHYPVLKGRHLHRYTVQKAYYEGDKEGVRTIVRQLSEELQRLKSYPRYQRDLAPYFRMIGSEKTWNESRDIRSVWKLPPYRS